MKTPAVLEKDVQRLMADLGIDLTQEGLQETPRRVAKMYQELLEGYQHSAKDLFKVFNSDNYDGLIVVANIPFHSLCEHHLLPFYGQAHIGYVPGEKILGLSKFARLVELYARRLQVQERMTEQIACDVEKYLQPKGVIVSLEAEHMCMSMRGIKKPGSVTKTISTKGICSENQNYTDLFFQQISKER